MQCCGIPFAIGQEISWLLAEEVDRDFLASVTDAETAQSIDFAYEHHGRLSEDAPHTTGKVVQTYAVHSRYAPTHGGDDRTLYPVPGSGQIAAVDCADGWESETTERHFNGYVVQVELPDAGG